ncbi:MAG: hypothetical protein ABSF81_15435 [Bacteroidales bacterium]
MFPYFLGQDKGMYLALSTDGYQWEQLNNGQPVLIPHVGSQNLMRDPSIHKGADGIYRVVWTTGWAGKDIAAGVDSIGNCWAPEIFFDELKNQLMIFWSSNIGKRTITSVYPTTFTGWPKLPKVPGAKSLVQLCPQPATKVLLV